MSRSGGRPLVLGAGEPQVRADAPVVVDLHAEYTSALHSVRCALHGIHHFLRQRGGRGRERCLRAGDPMVEGLARETSGRTREYTLCGRTSARAPHHRAGG